jgi:hypothetical protein
LRARPERITAPIDHGVLDDRRVERSQFPVFPPKHWKDDADQGGGEAGAPCGIDGLITTEPEPPSHARHSWFKLSGLPAARDLPRSWPSGTASPVAIRRLVWLAFLSPQLAHTLTTATVPCCVALEEVELIGSFVVKSSEFTTVFKNCRIDAAQRHYRAAISHYQQPAEEPLGRGGAAPALDQDVDDIPFCRRRGKDSAACRGSR